VLLVENSWHKKFVPAWLWKKNICLHHTISGERLMCSLSPTHSCNLHVLLVLSWLQNQCSPSMSISLPLVGKNMFYTIQLQEKGWCLHSILHMLLHILFLFSSDDGSFTQPWINNNPKWHQRSIAFGKGESTVKLTIREKTWFFFHFKPSKLWNFRSKPGSGAVPSPDPVLICPDPEDFNPVKPGPPATLVHTFWTRYASD